MANNDNKALLAKIAALEAQVAKLKTQGERPLTCKVSDKGALALYGMGRFPVTLYKEQWNRIFEHSDEIKEFIVNHDDELRSKGEELSPEQEAAIAAKKAEFAAKQKAGGR